MSVRGLPCAAGVALLLAGVMLSAGGCGNSGVNSANRMIDSMQDVVDLLRTVQDAPSARAAIGKLQPAFDDFVVALKEVAEIERDGGEVRGLKTQIAQLDRDLNRATAELQRESERLEAIRGLPAEFWSEYRMAGAELAVGFVEAAAIAGVADSAEVAAATASIQQIQTAYKTHGPEHVAEITIRGGRDYDRDEAVVRLERLAGGAAEIVLLPDSDAPDDLNVMVAPVGDLAAFRDAIDFGTVTDFIPERGEILLEVTEDLAGPYAGMTEQQIAQQKQAEAERAEAQRQREEQLAQQEAARKKREADEAKRRAEEEERQRPPERGKPDYFPKLLANLQDPQAAHHRTSIEHLLELKPSDAPDDQTREQLVAALRELVLAGGTNYAGDSPTDDAIRCLVGWAGEAAAPTLLARLKDSSQQIDAALLEGLAAFPSEEAATALAGKVKESQQQREAIAETLAAMGPVAEQPLLALIPDDSAEVNIAVINALGQCGTKASLRTMRLAARSENDQVAQAARDAADAIRERAKTTDQ